MKKKKGQTPKSLIEVARLIDIGHTYKDVADIYNVNVQTVRNWITSIKKQGIGILSTQDKTKIRYVLQLLYIDIGNEKSIQDKCNEVMITLASGGIKPEEARLMAQGVEWFINELIGKVK